MPMWLVLSLYHAMHGQNHAVCRWLSPFALGFHPSQLQDFVHEQTLHVWDAYPSSYKLC